MLLKTVCSLLPFRVNCYIFREVHLCNFFLFWLPFSVESAAKQEFLLPGANYFLRLDLLEKFCCPGKQLKSKKSCPPIKDAGKNMEIHPYIIM